MEQSKSHLPLLVVGGGISGMTTAIEAAEAGSQVILVEKLPYLGGNAIGMNRYFPKMCPPYCGMEINFQRIRNNPLIELKVSSQVTKIDKTDRGYSLTIETAPVYVNSNCTACGDCASVCIATQPDPFNQFMSSKKAIDLPHDLAFPEYYYLDESFCEKEVCNKCFKVCSYNAIDLHAKPTDVHLEVGSIVLATGWQSMNPKDLPEFSFGQHPDILTNLMMERMAALNGPTKGLIQTHKDGNSPQKISFIQCAGSRDQNHLPYCSGVCCSASLKQALHAVEALPDVEVTIHYIDLRVTGRNEDFLQKVMNHPRINLIKGKATAVHCESSAAELSITAEDIAAGKKKTYSSDLVVLALGLIPDEDAVNDLLPERRSYMDFYNLPDGIQLVGCAQAPMDISASVKNATGAALSGLNQIS